MSKPIPNKELIRAYLEGKLDARAMHALEKQALEDPFLASALEGYNQIKSNPVRHLDDLATKIQKRIEKRRKRILFFSRNDWAIAATIALVLISAIAVVWFNSTKEEKLISENIKQAVSPSSPSDSTIAPESKASPAKEPAEPKNRSSLEESKWGERIEIVKNDGNRVSEPAMTEIAKESTEKNKADINSEDAFDNEVLGRNKREETRKQTAELTYGSVAAAPTKKSATAILQGKVVDKEEGMPLPGVSVQVRGTTIATQTDANGNYKLDMPQDKTTLDFTYIGYERKSLEVGKDQLAHVVLEQDERALSEVVVTGLQGKAGGVQAEGGNNYISPRPVRGFEDFELYLRTALRYPNEAKLKKIEGRVRIRFTVDSNGKPDNFKVVKSLGYGCDEEAVRLIKEGPAWLPASSGNIQTVYVTVGFKL